MATTGSGKHRPAPPAGSESRTRRLVARLRPHGRLGWARRAAATGILGLILLGLYQACVAVTPSLHTTATLVQAPVTAVDVWRSPRTDSVRLTLVAPVTIEPITVNGVRQGPAHRVLYDAPATAVVGDRLPVVVSQDGRQVRTGSLPGPAVLPGPQGATLLFLAGLWLALFTIMRAREKSTR